MLRSVRSCRYMFLRRSPAHVGRPLVGAVTLAAVCAVGLCGCAQVTGLADYEDATPGERLFSFDSDGELSDWRFEGCGQQRVTDVGGQNSGALRLSATTARDCVASASFDTQRSPSDYSQLGLWLRSANYDTVTIRINGVNNRIVICSPNTETPADDCGVVPEQGNLAEGVLQLVELSDVTDAGTPIARGEITRFTITVPAGDTAPADDIARADNTVLYVDDIWLK